MWSNNTSWAYSWVLATFAAAAGSLPCTDRLLNLSGLGHVSVFTFQWYYYCSTADSQRLDLSLSRLTSAARENPSGLSTVSPPKHYCMGKQFRSLRPYQKTERSSHAFSAEEKNNFERRKHPCSCPFGKLLSWSCGRPCTTSDSHNHCSQSSHQELKSVQGHLFSFSSFSSIRSYCRATQLPTSRTFFRRIQCTIP